MSLTQENIQEYIDNDINPGLAMHGGHLEISTLNSETGVLEIKLGGGCQGCASSTATLKLMIENALKMEFPDINEIVDVTDHNAGLNPFFRT